MLKPKRIVVVGSGRLAEALLASPALTHHNHVELAARNLVRQQQLCADFHCLPFDANNTHEATVLLCVNDSALAETAATFGHIARVMVHFSGTSAPIEGENYDSAVMWPVHSFGEKERPVWTQIPWVTEHRGHEAERFVSDFLAALGCTSVMLDVQQRRQLHLAAVVMNNFGNHLATLAFEWCTKQGLPASTLQHLVEQTFSRLRFTAPEAAQTGPARRGDNSTIEQHLNMLNANPQLQEIYRMFSKQIAERYL